MKPVVLVLGVGFAAILSIACQQPTAYSAPPPAVPQVCRAKGIASADDFIKQRGFFLPASFDPRTGSPPPNGQNIYGQNPYSTALIATFNAAPASFLAMLCDFDYYVYIVQNACAASGCTANDVINYSWGFRQQSSSPKRYIATSATLWQNGSVPIFSIYRQLRLQAILQHLDPNAGDWFHPPSNSSTAPPPFPRFTSASSDTSEMTLLAVLAHETGHVLWYDAFVPTPGGTFNAANFCNGNFYPSGEWSNINIPHVNDTPGRWINFGEVLPNETHNPDLTGPLKAQLSQRQLSLIHI